MTYWRTLGQAIVGQHSQAVVRMATTIERTRHHRSHACHHDLHQWCEGPCKWCARECRCPCHFMLDDLYGIIATNIATDTGGTDDG
jgi:hypothetical protein